MQHIQKILNAILSKKVFEYLVVDKHFVIEKSSMGLFKYLENAPMPQESVFEHFPELVGYEDRILEVMRGETPYFKLQTIKKGEYWFDIYVDRYEEDRVLLLLHNVTAFTVTQHRLLQYSNEQTLVRSTLEQIIENNQMICVIDQNNVIAFANESFRNYFDLDTGDTLSTKVLQLNEYVDIDDFYFKALHHGALINVKKQYFEVEAKPIDALYRLFLFKDITAVYTRTAALEKALRFDTLTGLLSRRAFEESVITLIAEKRSFLFCVLDLDDFKKINDTYGHNRGDSTLREFGSFCRYFFGEGVMMGRWGGEEFLMVIERSRVEDAIKTVDDFRKRLATHPFEENIVVTVSIGATWCNQNDSFEELFLRADKAMYRAKTEGKNRIVLDAPIPTLECS